VPSITLPLGFWVVFEKLTFVTCYEPIKKICFSFDAFKHFCRRFDSTNFLIVIQMFWNHLCTHCSRVQILCKNLVDRTFINIEFIGDHSNYQTSILMNERNQTVDVGACSHRGEASMSGFICHRFSPIYKNFESRKYFST
jgi:hypothetical protein